MTRAAMVQYRTRADAADRNQELIERVLAEFHREQPGGVRYLALRLEDGVSFVHIAAFDGAADPFTGSPAFAEFQRTAGERLVVAPTTLRAGLIGAYDGFAADLPIARRNSDHQR
ncbi:hypothetical protein [Nocardia yunnanensis]|uniref:hypothetical protein n=1 Tax=Nocardia yunnanensis TaxID=2382165 RepID=UPI001656B72B|nr:hypothetical protein [Nocardia yunnanensis]